jgi:coproporphyrinogen III oxidase
MSSTPRAALELVESLQQRMVACVEGFGDGARLEAISWKRDGGRHGGGTRYVAALTGAINRAAVNVSHVHYDDEPARKLASATALSTIIHPVNPHAPSVHMHISWTEMKSGAGGWRVMADLNPSIPKPADAASFLAAIERAAPGPFAAGRAQGDKYFFIPSLDRHRGAAHFYLEGYCSGDDGADLAMARRVGEGVIDHYGEIVAAALAASPEPTEADRAAQLAYHSVYFLQVLTLDRGTTSGLLIHDENDVGILGSIPAFVDRARLASWIDRQPPPQDQLLSALIGALPDVVPTPVDDACRAELAAIVRRHYRQHPGALDLQAAGDAVPTTVDNHID